MGCGELNKVSYGIASGAQSIAAECQQVARLGAIITSYVQRSDGFFVSSSVAIRRDCLASSEEFQWGP
jgi:hypothetical protein